MTLPIELDGYDISILKSLSKDGRKSFRKVSRETGISTPTVKARFERLVNVGFIKAVKPQALQTLDLVPNQTCLSEHLGECTKFSRILLDIYLHG
jgi:predicted transcriptional regulator